MSSRWASPASMATTTAASSGVSRVPAASRLKRPRPPTWSSVPYLQHHFTQPPALPPPPPPPPPPPLMGLTHHGPPNVWVPNNNANNSNNTNHRGVEWEPSPLQDWKTHPQSPGWGVLRDSPWAPPPPTVPPPHHPNTFVPPPPPPLPRQPPPPPPPLPYASTKEDKSPSTTKALASLESPPSLQSPSVRTSQEEYETSDMDESSDEDLPQSSRAPCRETPQDNPHKKLRLPQAPELGSNSNETNAKERERIRKFREEQRHPDSAAQQTQSPWKLGLETAKKQRASLPKKKMQLKEPPKQDKLGGQKEVSEQPPKILLKEARAKLMRAKAKLIKALRQQQATPPPETRPPALPPITALNQSLKISEISKSGPPQMVRHLPVPKKPEVEYCSDSCVTEDESKEEPARPCAQQNTVQKKKEESVKLQKNLLLLKRKLKLKMALANKRQRVGEPPSTDSSAPCDAESTTKPQQLSVLKKRQEKLRQDMDSAYWKQLVVKHRNLLEAEKKIVAEQDKALLIFREKIALQEKETQKFEESAREAQVREEQLDLLIEEATKNLLNTRKRRYDLKRSAEL
mmetsp:Transcript_6751/g.15441  ORF Transcript_6751/g.15441 Transcript_6751/m.15441 type:complete len:573 (+) Transcript_6751:80-1798(+)